MTELGTTEFTDLQEIGRGGFGVVYTAHQPSFDRTVAIKVLSLADENTVRRFDRERQALGKVSNHPHITPVFASGFTADGKPYIAMELMRGGSLRERIEIDGPMPWQEVLDVGVKLAGALETAHRSGILHRDLKPANVLLSDFGEPRLADFGIASIDDGEHTKTGMITASVAFAAPEVLDGARPGVPADVYGLGATLFTLVAGRPPFSADEDESSILAMVVRVARDPVPDLRQRGVPGAFAAVLEKAMAKGVADRYPTAHAFGTALRDAQHQLGIRQTPMVLPTSQGSGGAASLATTSFEVGDPTSTSGSWTQEGGAPPVPVGERPGVTPATPASPPPGAPPTGSPTGGGGVHGGGSPSDSAPRRGRWAAIAAAVLAAGVVAALLILPGGDETADDVTAEDPGAEDAGPEDGDAEDADPAADADAGDDPVAEDQAGDDQAAGDLEDEDAADDEPADDEPAADDPTVDDASEGAVDAPDVDGWVTGRAMPVARQQIPGVALRGRVWVAGGLAGDGVTSSVEGYEMATNSWRSGPDLPLPLHHHMSTTYGEDLVVLGGWTPQGSLLSAITSDQVWALRGSSWVELPPLLQPRVAGAAATVGDLVVVVGGQDVDGELVTTTEVFDGETWREAAPMPTPREHLAAASDGQYVYVIGGRELSADANLATFERYDPVADVWEQLPDMPTARGGLAAAVVDGIVLAIGGERPLGVFAEVEAYDIASGSWSTLPPLPTGRHGLAAGTVGSNVIAIGGALEASHAAATDTVELTGVG